MPASSTAGVCVGSPSCSSSQYLASNGQFRFSICDIFLAADPPSCAAGSTCINCTSISTNATSCASGKVTGCSFGLPSSDGTKCAAASCTSSQQLSTDGQSPLCHGIWLPLTISILRRHQVLRLLIPRRLRERMQRGQGDGLLVRSCLGRRH